MSRLTIVLVLVVMAGSVFADVPRIISYQGRLADASGNPINGTRNITFKLYTAETGGSPIWTETHNNVSISNGLYNVMLGSQTAFPDSVNFSSQYWLGVTIGTDPEMTPRYKLGASPYALNLYSLGATNGQILKWNSTNLRWEPAEDEYGVSGSGTINTIPLWSETTTLTSSPLKKIGGSITLNVSITDSAGLNVRPFGSSLLYGVLAKAHNRPAGTSWNLSYSNSAGIYGNTESPRAYSAGVFGFNWYAPSAPDHTAGVVGAAGGTDVFGGLAYKISDTTFAGYFKGKSYFDGNVKVVGNISVTEGQLMLGAPSGTQPLKVTSTTKVDSLNADMVDGFHASAFSAKGSWTLMSSSSQTITFPHYSAFILIVGEMYGVSEFTGMLVCTENDGRIAYTRITSDGIAGGTANEASVPAVELMNLGSGRIVVKTDGDTDWDHTLVITSGLYTEVSIKLIY